MDDLDFENPDPADDRVWSLIDRFLAGESSADDAGAIRAWPAAAPGRGEWLESARRIRELAGNRPPARSAAQAWRQAVAELGIDPGLTSEGHPPPTRERPPFRLTLGLRPAGTVATWLPRIAAALVVAVGGSV